MSLPKESWDWWGEEGGKKLRVSRTPQGKMYFEIIETSGSPNNTVVLGAVTIASFRVTQLREWMCND